MGLAEMEEVDMDAWFAGRTQQPWVPKAIESYTRAQKLFAQAAGSCARFQVWFPKDRREEVTPDIEHFENMSKLIGEVIDTLRRGGLPTLTLIHTITGDMRREQAVAERKAVSLRGTPGHFPAGAH